MAKATVKKMKKAEEDYKSLLIHYKEAKCEIETLNGELSEAYTKVIFLEQVQANTKIERVSTKKLDDVISSQKHFSDKSGLGYTGGSSSSGNVTKEVKFIKAKEKIEVGPTAEKPKMEEKRNMDEKRMLNNSRNQSMADLNPKPSLVHDHKEVLDRTMYVITVDFKGIPDQIVKVESNQ